MSDYNLDAWDHLCDAQEAAAEYEEQRDLMAAGEISPGTCARHGTVFVPCDDCPACMQEADEAEYQHWQEMERLERQPPDHGTVDRMMDDYHADAEAAHQAAVNPIDNLIE
jgi:hypothetical protein